MASRESRALQIPCRQVERLQQLDRQAVETRAQLSKRRDLSGIRESARLPPFVQSALQLARQTRLQLEEFADGLTGETHRSGQILRALHHGRFPLWIKDRAVSLPFHGSHRGHHGQPLRRKAEDPAHRRRVGGEGCSQYRCSA